MKARLTCLALVVVAAVAFVSAAQSDGARTLMEAARKREVVDGDLKGAIQQYQAVVDKYKSERAVVADALVRMAECYQKLGDAEAHTIYRRIVREYADQTDAIGIARARLGNSVPASTRGDRAAWTGPKVDMFGQVSPDGRYLTFVDWGGESALMVHDLVTNTDHALTAAPSPRFAQFAEFSTISRDGKHVAYAWYNDKGRYDLRVAALQPIGVAEPRILFDSSGDIISIAPQDWSPDGKWIAVNLQRGDGTGQIALVSVAGGSLRVLKSTDWRGATKIAFSPDSRYLAYDLATVESDAERHVYVMAIDASSESEIVRDPSRNVLMAWAWDGSGVLFASNRTGQPALWMQRVANGNAQGRPMLVKRDIGSSFSLGLTRTGTLYVYKGRSANFVQVASLDLAAAAIRPVAGKTFHRFIGSGGTPSWTSDGKYLVYKSCGDEPRATCAINIASPESGDVRQGWPKLTYLGGLLMSNDGGSFTAVGRDVKGRQGLYRIDGQTFSISPIVSPRAGAIEVLSPDERTLYVRRSDPRGATLVARDLATGVERDLFRQAQNGSMTLSPDGRFIASVVRSMLYLIPTAGGAAKEILRDKEEGMDGYRAQWTPDGKSLLMPKRFADKPIELWLIPMFEAGQPRKLDADTSEWALAGGGFAIHPSGRQIAFIGMAGRQNAEVWAFENVLPASRSH
jgi:Tol biopolymer transport system component